MSEHNSNSSTYKAVMLIDDSEIDNLINKKMLEGTMFAERIYVHTSSKSALEFLKNLDRNQTLSGVQIPEFIFLDINMPLMDGFQFLEEFSKLSEEIRNQAQIIMLTSSVNPADVERASEFGKVYKYLNKPLSINQLNELIEKAA